MVGKLMKYYHLKSENLCCRHVGYKQAVTLKASIDIGNFYLIYNHMIGVTVRELTLTAAFFKRELIIYYTIGWHIQYGGMFCYK